MLKIFMAVIVCLIGYAQSLHGQQAVTSGGNYHHNNTVSITYTVGESATKTLKGTDNIITQGFLQTKLIVTGIYELPILDYKITAFPNPASESIRLTTEKAEGMWYELYDLKGNRLLHEQLKELETLIPVIGLESACYLLRIFEGKKAVKSFKIVKQ